MQNDDTNFDVVAYTKCVNFAAIKHKNQRRKDPEKTPYINHPIGMIAMFIAKSMIRMTHKFEYFRRREYFNGGSKC